MAKENPKPLAGRAEELMGSKPEDEAEVFRDFLDDAVALNFNRGGTIPARTPSGLLIAAIVMLAEELERRPI